MRRVPPNKSEALFARLVEMRPYVHLDPDVMSFGACHVNVWQTRPMLQGALRERLG